SGLAAQNTFTDAAKTFTGTGNWSDPARWGGSLPGSGDDVFINGTCTFDLSSVTVKSLTINSGGSLSIPSGTLTVAGNIDMGGGGSLTVNAGNLTMTAGPPTLEGTLTVSSGTFDTGNGNL